jgi:rhamnulokinase
VHSARESETTLLLDPDAEEFSKPCDMPQAIRSYAEKTGQPVPETPGEYTRAILESLALRYRGLVTQLREWMPDLPDTLHIVGGGSQNALLNQMAADATGLRVVAGPVEATAIGNVLAQLMAAGEISSLEEGREIVRASFEPQVFEPQTSASWDEKAGRFAALS